MSMGQLVSNGRFTFQPLHGEANMEPAIVPPKQATFALFTLDANGRCDAGPGVPKACWNTKAQKQSVNPFTFSFPE